MTQAELHSDACRHDTSIVNTDDQPVARDPVGPRAVALLRRVREAGGAYRCARNVDRDAAGRCETVGYIKRDTRDEELLYLTEEGHAHLDRLMRAV